MRQERDKVQQYTPDHEAYNSNVVQQVKGQFHLCNLQLLNHPLLLHRFQYSVFLLPFEYFLP